MKRLLVILAVIVVAGLFLLPACPATGGLTREEQSRLEMVREMKDLEKRLGFAETRNFLTYQPETQAYDYYFYTSATELPYSLDDPRLRSASGTAANATVDRENNDVFFYSIEAVAEIGTPVTRSLIRAPLARFIRVVFHEDWHEQIALPLGIEEPTGEVVSYAAATLFALEKFGADSAVYRTLAGEFGGRLAESRVYGDTCARLEALYAEYDAGRLSRPETLRRKAELLRELAGGLRGIWGAAPEQLNNAYLGFQMTYLRHMPAVYAAYAAQGGDLARTVALFRQMPGQGEPFPTLADVKALEQQALAYLRQ
ncbi:MAG: aminopeptidase [Chloroflexota bacterium]